MISVINRSSVGAFVKRCVVRLIKTGSLTAASVLVGSVILVGANVAYAATSLSVPAQAPSAALSTGTATYNPISWSGGTGSDYVELSAIGLPTGATFSDSGDGTSGCAQETSGAFTFTHANVATSAVALGTYTFTVTATEYSNSDCTATTSATASGTGTLVVKFAPTIMASSPATGAPGVAIANTSINSTLASGSITPIITGTITFTVFGPQTIAPTTCTSGGSIVGTAIVSGNGSYNSSASYAPTSVGNYWWYASYSGDANNAVATSTCGTGMSETTVGHSSPTVTWPTPSSITYGTALSSTQLDATASIAGTFTYTPPAGSILPVGPETLTVIFAPTDTVDYHFVTATVLLTVNPPVPPIRLTSGYLVTTSTGTVYAYGQAVSAGGVSTNPTTRPVVAIGRSPGTHGYYLVTSIGNVYNEGGAPFYGSKARTHLTSPISALAATPDGKGYWLASKNGTVYPFGDAASYSSLSLNPTNRPVVAIASSADGKGYYLVTSLGNVYNEGDAVFYGSKAASRLPHSIVAFALSADGKGYDLVSSGGNIWNLGDAPFFGSKAAVKLASPIAAFVTTLDGRGYYLLSQSGQLFAYADAIAYGSPSVSGAVTVSSMTIPS